MAGYLLLGELLPMLVGDRSIGNGAGRPLHAHMLRWWLTRPHLGAHREVEATKRPHITGMKAAHWDARLAASGLKLGLRRDATELTCGAWRHHVGSETKASRTKAVCMRNRRTRALGGHVLWIVALLEKLL